MILTKSANLRGTSLMVISNKCFRKSLFIKCDSLIPASSTKVKDFFAIMNQGKIWQDPESWSILYLTRILIDMNEFIVRQQYIYFFIMETKRHTGSIF